MLDGRGHTWCVGRPVLLVGLGAAVVAEGVLQVGVEHEQLVEVLHCRAAAMRWSSGSMFAASGRHPSATAATCRCAAKQLARDTQVKRQRWLQEGLQARQGCCCPSKACATKHRLWALEGQAHSNTVSLRACSSCWGRSPGADAAVTVQVLRQPTSL